MDESKIQKAPQKPEEQEIDLIELAQKVWAERKMLYKVCGIAAVIGLIVGFSIPKEYSTEVTLAPESASKVNAGSEVNEALVKYQTAKEKAAYYDKQIMSLNKAFESTSLLMQHGNTTYLEVLTAQQTLLSAQLNQVANRFAEIQGVINLYQALGGGRD